MRPRTRGRDGLRQHGRRSQYGRAEPVRLLKMKNKEVQDKNQQALLADPVMPLALAWVSAIFLGWPLIQIVGEHGTAALFIYIFAVWSGLIILLFAISRSLRHTPSENPAGERDE